MQQWKEYTERVRDANPLVDVISSFGVKLKSMGRYRMVCCSPLRSEKDPSFMVYTDQETWCDFGTRQTGDVFDLVQAKEGCSFADAVKSLGERVGMPWKGGNGGGEPLEPEVIEEMERLTERRFVEKIATDAAEYYHQCLRDDVREYLRKHYGFTEAVINDLRIGWADGTLFDHLRHTLNYPFKDILRTGLFIHTQGGRVIEHHQDRITFGYPRGGKFPYMISRRIDGLTPDNEYQAAKYKKTLVKSANHDYVSRHVKNDIFFGEDSARRKTERLLVCEGVTDAISVMMCDWPVISPVTVRFKKAEIERCVKLTENADITVIVNDHERAVPHPKTGKPMQPGLDGAADTAKALYEAGRDVRIAILPLADGADKIDVNEFVRDYGKDALDEVVRNALPYPEFLVSRVPVDTRPAELDEALSPAYKIIAACPPVQREAYENVICKRFSLTKDTVADAVGEFVRVRSKKPAGRPTKPAESPPAAPPAEPPSEGGGSGGEGGGGSEPPISIKELGEVYGAVFEDADGNYYYRMTPTRKGDYIEEILSNFIFVPRCTVKIKGEKDKICCDVHCADGRVIKKVVLGRRTFRTLKDFCEEIQTHYPYAIWTGTHPNVMGVLQLLAQSQVGDQPGVIAMGYTEVDERDERGVKHTVAKWVGPDYTITKDGLTKESNVIFAAEQKPPIATSINLSGATLSNDDIRVLAQKVMSLVFKLNKPDVILPTLGWFYASIVTPVIRDALGHMPILWIWGSQGCGKSTLVRELFSKLVGLNKEPLSCQTTRFVLVRYMSSVTSIAVILDEYKLDLPIANQQAIQRLLRSGYIGEDDPRGRPDLTLQSAKICAPTCVIGEMMPSDPALLERIVCVSPEKHNVTAETSQIISALAGENLLALAGHFTRWVLTRDIRKDLKTARALMEAKMLPKLAQPLPPRLLDNITVVVLGDYLHREWCDEIGVKIIDRPKIEDVFLTIVRNITDSESGGGVRDGFDRFLESCSTYAHLGVLREGVHYMVNGDGKLCLHLASCYNAYLEARRKSGQVDETNGLSSLRRIIKEKFEAGGSYVLDQSRRERFSGGEHGKGGQVRTVVIDQALIPEHLAVERFPCASDKYRPDTTQQEELGDEGWN